MFGRPPEKLRGPRNARRDFFSQRAFLLPVLLAGLLLGLGGCTPGILWRNYTYEPVHADAVRDRKPLFVYFRHWASVDCTKFEEQVLKDPRVREATAAFYCVPLQIDWDHVLAERWGIPDPPGVVLLAPDERVLARLSGAISIDQLLNAMNAAAAAGSQSAPTSNSAKAK